MKCEIPRCQRVLVPDDTYETDAEGKYRRVCRKCYEKLTGEAATQVGAGRFRSPEGTSCKAVAAPLQLGLAL